MLSDEIFKAWQSCGEKQSEKREACHVKAEEASLRFLKTVPQLRQQLALDAQAALDGEPLGEELGEAASIAKSCCSDASFFNAGSAIQVHGGTGFTWEYDVHLYFKRARATESYLGDGSCHRERLARKLLDTAVNA